MVITKRSPLSMITHLREIILYIYIYIYIYSNIIYYVIYYNIYYNMLQYIQYIIYFYIITCRKTNETNALKNIDFHLNTKAYGISPDVKLSNIIQTKTS